MRPSSSWEKASTEELLDRRMYDLELDLDGCSLSDMVERARDELDHKRLRRFRPHCYLSDEWLSPDGIPGVVWLAKRISERLRGQLPPS